MNDAKKDALIGSVILTGLIGIGVVIGVPIGRYTVKESTPTEEVVIKGHVTHLVSMDRRTFGDSVEYTKYYVRFSDRNSVDLWISTLNPVSLHNFTYQEFVAVPMKDKSGLQLIRNSCPAVYALQVAQWKAAREGLVKDFYSPVPEADGCPEEEIAALVGLSEDPADKPEPIVYNNGE